MKRRFLGQATLPNLFYRPQDGVLSVPGFTFEKATPWKDTGSVTILAEGSSLKDGSNVLAKIAPAQSNGSMLLEREAHILGLLAHSKDGYATALRVIDFINIPRDSGDCVVLLLAHPGLNILGRYLPPSRVNDLLLADVGHVRPSSSHGDIYMLGIEEPDLSEEMEAFDIMDLASFLEFAIQATHCLEVVHKCGVVHREVRANAFHLNSQSDSVRLVHLGNRSISLENFGSPSSLVLRAYEETEKLKVKEALCYLAPEQTGAIETITQDHRTDIYSLGILFWTLLVGRGQMPFEGGPLELLHAIVQKRPMPVHEVRRDVPQVLAAIVDKLLAKSPDARYQSAHGLKTDLIECQRRLLASVSSATDESADLIPPFEIAMEDRFMEFTIPIALFGRDKELELVRNVIRNISTNFGRQYSASSGVISARSTGSQETSTGLGFGESESLSSRSGDSSAAMATDTVMRSLPRESPSQDMGSATALGPSISPSIQSTDSLRRAALRSKPRLARAQVVVITGLPGVGKSSIILANQAKWRSHGLWGQAKFQQADSAPFAAVLACLSAVLRQLMVFQTDLHRFVTTLRERLGPQLQNAPLLYQGAPELRDILALFDINLDTPREPLNSRELRARFQALVEHVFQVIAETRLLALFLDDLHEADESTLDLVAALVHLRSRMLIFITLRSDKDDVVERVRGMFSDRSRPTWINVEPLSFTAISTFVSKTLRRPKEDCVSLSRFIYSASSGNAFSARSILTTLQRQHHITFHWEKNYWQFDMASIEAAHMEQAMVDPSDSSFLISHFRELPEDARKYLIWASLLGETFKATEVALMMDWEDSSGSSSSSSEDEDDQYNPYKVVSKTRSNATGDQTPGQSSVRGLQKALEEGWVVQRARDMCSFAHDRYRQAALAEAENLSPDNIAKMSSRVVLMMLHEAPVDVYRIAEHAKRCLAILHEHPKRQVLLEVLLDAGESAWARGAHELALRSFTSARTLLPEDPWSEKPQRTMALFSRLAAIATWKGEFDESNAVIQECLSRTDHPEHQASLLRLRSLNHWMRNNYSAALNDTIQALRLLGIEVNPVPTKRDAEKMFEQVKNEILAVGFDEILSIPRTTDSRSELAVSLLNDAGTNAYWSPSPFAFSDVIGLTTIKLALRSGMSPGTALGFFWALGAATDRRELYRFSCDLGKLALKIAERHGSSSDKCQAYVLFSAMVAPFDNIHIRINIPRLEEAVKYGNSAGDRVYTSFASLHMVSTRLFICEHLNELVVSAEECLSDVKVWVPNSDSIILAQGLLNCIRALGGYTYGHSAETAFDTDTYTEREYYAEAKASAGNVDVAFNWYDAFKVVGLFNLGFVEEAATLGFYVYETRERHPNHRHNRWAMFFHSLSMIACLRKSVVPPELRERYRRQIMLNQDFIKRWQSPSPVNTSTWLAIVDAELASLNNDPSAFKRYDTAVTLAINNDWLLEEGWALFLQGCHFIRCGVEGLGSELQRRSIARHSQWGAQGVANHLSSIIGPRSQLPMKRHIFTSDVAVQTESDGIRDSHLSTYDTTKADGDEGSTLTAPELFSILKWSQEISSDINLAAALQRLTEIATESSGSQLTCVVIAREAGDYTLATSMAPPQPCQVYEHPRPLRSINDPMQRAVIQHTLNSKERLFSNEVHSDARFSAEAQQSIHRAVVCLPIFSNRGQTFGAVYVASRFAFSQNTNTLLTLLCQQASISISNALLFRSVQTGTKENLKMIATQKDALEEARKSREAALKATKIKSNFLASMSHELRTPFSSFYGLLDLLSSTDLNPGQNEIVQTAKQSCELLLKIIDSILDYSKLEASALKLEPCGFQVENIIADCMELLLPMAATKLDLSFNIEPNVPPWVFADDARIRQVLMNLIGNAVKFTAKGFVQVTCSVETVPMQAPDEVQLKFVIQDTGIGLSPSDVELLFVPFQQADSSTTRRFGGTGLGLSISKQLIKLMSGVIGVKSELHVGSMFWFTIPVKIFNSEEAQKSMAEMEQLRSRLLQPVPPRVLVCSASKVTLGMLNTMLQGFLVTLVSNDAEAEHFLRTVAPTRQLDFVILDDQSEKHAEDMARFLNSLGLNETKVIHMYTPTTGASGQPIFGSSIPGVVKMTKPPRRVRLLQALAGLKEVPNTMTSNQTTQISRAIDDVSAARRTLYGNVLVAEDNLIAQNLLVKQLQRYQLNVTPTSNGNEALAQWESHEPGYFSVALFDHHMPICDGVEAAKRLRQMEAKRKCSVSLPIVALSADCQETTKQLCLSAGMNAFFSKPLKKPDLMSLLSMFGHSPADVS